MIPKPPDLRRDGLLGGDPSATGRREFVRGGDSFMVVWFLDLNDVENVCVVYGV